jgi:integrase
MRARKRGAGEGTISARPNGTWAAAVTMADGRRRWLYAKTRAEVAAKLTAALKDAADGRSWGDSRQTVEQYMRWWLSEQAQPKTRPATFTTYKMYVERHILPELGAVRLARLSPQHVQALLNRKSAEGLQPRSVRQIRAILRRALGQALKQGLVHVNAAQLVDPPRVEHHEIRPLTPAQARQFLDGIRGDRNEALYSVALALGLRRGEALGLQWADIDLDAGTLTVRRSLQRVARELRFVEPKTSKSRRTIALPRFAIDALRAHRVRQLEERMRLGDVYQDQGLVFARPDGHALNDAGVTHGLQRTLKRLDLPRQRFHDLRHGAASLMRAQGADLKVISSTLGHSTIGITADLYTHLFPEVSREAADRMDAMLGGRKMTPLLYGCSKARIVLEDTHVTNAHNSALDTQ